MELTNKSKEEIIEEIKEGKVGAAELTDAGICPTCFNRENGDVLYGDNSSKIIYENEMFECFLVGNPRAEGHVAISTKKHFKDMMEIDDLTCREIFLLAKKVMIVLKAVYGSESVWPMNYFHVQLIPRYSFEKRGSNNFVKPRMEYVEDTEKVMALRKELDYKEKQ